MEEPQWSRSKTDLELVSLYQQNQSTQIVAILLQRYGYLLEIYFHRFLTSDESALELAHKFIPIVSKRLKQAKIVKSFPGWLARCIKSNLLDEIDRINKQGEKESGFVERFPLEPSMALDQQVDINRFLQCIKTWLPAHEYQILEDKYYFGYSFKEIAQRHSMGQKKVQNICFRTLKKLKKENPCNLPLDFFTDLSS